MSKYIFQRIMKEGIKRNLLPGPGDDNAKARKWFRSQALKLSKVNTKNFFKGDSENLHVNINRLNIGKMYLFQYDPKGKDTLPYYDIFPLIFPIEYYGDGFLGINLHYLSPMHRAILMDALYSLYVKGKDKLKLSYQILKSASKYKYFKPCVKRYLFTQVRSKFFEVSIDDWDIALMLPAQQFKYSTSKAVWKDSIGKI